MTGEDVRYDVDGGIATVTIDRPAVRNAFRGATVAELNEALARADDDGDVYAIVLTGSEGGFCAGADVTEMPDWSAMGEAAYGEFLSSVQAVVGKLRTNPTPTVAAVGGPAVGAGCDFALACDVRTAGPDALFSEAFVNVGLVPGDGGAWLLPRLIGEGPARELLLTGRDVDAERAAELGLVSEVVEDPLAEAYSIAEGIRDNPRLAVGRTKALLSEQGSFADHCESAIAYQWECVNDPEHEEAVAAFRERRDPDYDRSIE
ncbi:MULTISPECIES: enoyl-CoA hydratase/isomerase family protein [Haloferacaceae]|uniref:Enoyl-CoA hydratase/isomerase family protein n=1 Tax=Halorubrum glutamatedens TaxID=2707018 RepID=A0ABD5QR98_9EURY|nr:enoyl-CoA hydratase-related protein [Halobellus captivus]